MPKKRGHGSGALYYLESRKLWRGVAYYGEPDPETNRRPQKMVHSKKQKVCDAKLKALVAEIEEYGAPLDNSTTVAVWAEKWLDDHVTPNNDPSTARGYRSAVRRWIVPTIGRKPVRDLKPSDVSAVHKAVREAGRKTSTLRGVHIVLDLLLEQARREGLCKRNVAKDVRLPTIVKGKRGSLPVDKAMELLKVVADHDLGSYWWFKLLEAPRQGESLGATIADLDLDNFAYRVNWKLEEVSKRHGCGRLPEGVWRCERKQGAACPDAQWDIPHDFEMVEISGRWCLTRPKSQTGRYVPLIPQVASLIRDYLERHAEDPNPHGLIWRKPDGMPYLKKEEAQMWREVLLSVGLITGDQAFAGKSPIDGHWARHTTVTVLMMLVKDPQLVGEIVGHSSTEVTEIYRHADESEKHAAMNLLGGRMFELEP